MLAPRKLGAFSLFSGLNSNNMRKNLLFYLSMTSFFFANSQNISIAGNIQAAGNTALCGTTVILNDENGNTLANTTTDADGNYIFTDLTASETYEIEASRDINPLNGVSTFDVITLINHILDITPINDPLTLIALDVNNSESLTTFDLVLMRLVILTLHERFPADSWKIFSSNANIDDHNTWTTTRTYENLSISVNNANFIGYKTGDANNSPTIICE